MKVNLITGPTEMPVSREEAKAHLRIPASESMDDVYIDSLIEAATATCEQITNRKFVTQTWERYFDALPSTGGVAWAWDRNNVPAPTGFELPFAPLQSVTWIKYYDEQGAYQTLSQSVYQVDTYSTVGKVALKNNQLWPETEEYRLNSVEVRFACGYGPASAVPKGIKQAILLLVATWYENRETVVIGTSGMEIPNTIHLLLASYRNHYFQ